MDEVVKLANDLGQQELKRLNKAFAQSKAPDAVMRLVDRWHEEIDGYMSQNSRQHQIKLACHAGCSTCCTGLRVSVTAPEALRIKQHLETTLPPPDLQELTEKIRATASRSRGISTQDFAVARITCPFLKEGSCSIYAVRPSTCRRYHSVELDPCLRRAAMPETRAFGAVTIRGLNLGVTALMRSFFQALKKQRLDNNPYELSSAIADALDNPDAYMQWRQGKKIFGEPVRREKEASSETATVANAASAVLNFDDALDF